MYRKNAIKDFCVGDFVVYKSIKKSAGGVIFRITDVQPPVKSTLKKVTKIANYDYYNYNGQKQIKKGQTIEETFEIFVDAKGKKLPKAARDGYVRIVPVFEFFPASNYSVPKAGMLIPYNDICNYLSIVDTITLGTTFQKYQQFINMYVNKVMESDEPEKEPDTLAVQ